jgi:hypothetical protein
MPANVEGADLDQKSAAFFAYAAYDGGACHSQDQCDALSNYGAYLRRQYSYPYEK